MERVQVTFAPDEFVGLSRLAERDLRPVPNEVRHLVREALKDAGLLRELTTDAPHVEAAS
jgi:hypothetical protein